MRKLAMAVLLAVIVSVAGTADARCRCVWVDDDGERKQIQVCDSALDVPTVCGP